MTIQTWNKAQAHLDKGRQEIMIRVSEEKDEAIIYQFMCELEQAAFDKGAFARVYKEILEDSKHRIFLYCEGGKVLGILHLRVEAQLHHAADIAEIMELVVADGCRSKGVGKQLFRQACKVAEEWGCIQIEVASNQKRARAHQFYEREGMKNQHYKFSMPLH